MGNAHRPRRRGPRPGHRWCRVPRQHVVAAASPRPRPPTGRRRPASAGPAHGDIARISPIALPCSTQVSEHQATGLPIATPHGATICTSWDPREKSGNAVLGVVRGGRAGHRVRVIASTESCLDQQPPAAAQVLAGRGAGREDRPGGVVGGAVEAVGVRRATGAPYGRGGAL